MATTQTEISPDAQSPQSGRPGKKEQSVIDRGLAMLSSVRFGVTLLVILLICCMIGMLVVQQDAQGFREYFEKLSPSQRLLYGRLDLFNIYHSWYFTLLLAVTGLNIILASIDRFPVAWQYLSKPRRRASPKFIKTQAFNAEIETARPAADAAEHIRSLWRGLGWRPKVTEHEGRFTVFAQRNVWNRLGAYFVHVALLLIFFGGFLTNRLGVGGMLEIAPGSSSNQFKVIENQLDGNGTLDAILPFTVECTDIQQKLIKPEGGLDAMNTVDWLSFIRIRDGAKQIDALVHLNEPFDYRGYRFFQSQFQPVGNARKIDISFVPPGGKPIRAEIPRGQAVNVEGIGQVSYTNFFPDFTVDKGRPASASGDYNNPVAMLQIIGTDGKPRGAFAFNSGIADQFYGKDASELLVNGNRVLLDGFEKVATSHTLTVQYDPGRTPVYTGFIALSLSLFGVFFFAHQRVWAVVEPADGGSRIYMGGNTNRNRPAFETRFDSLVSSVAGKKGADSE